MCDLVVLFDCDRVKVPASGEPYQIHTRGITMDKTSSMRMVDAARACTITPSGGLNVSFVGRSYHQGSIAVHIGSLSDNRIFFRSNEHVHSDL